MNPSCGMMFSRCMMDTVRLTTGTFRLIPSRSVFLDSEVSSEATDKARPFEEMPGPKPLPLIGNLHRYIPIFGEYSAESYHASQLKKYKKYGKIVREQVVPGYNLVHLFDVKDIETLFRHEGKHPRRDFFFGIKTIRESKPEKYKSMGMPSANGEEWYKNRAPAQRELMHPQRMKVYYPLMNDVADRMIRRLRKVRNEQMKVPELMQEIFKWAMDSATYIIFGKAKGCLDEDLAGSAMVRDYIQAINDFFKYSGKVEMSILPAWRLFPKLSPSYRALEKSHESSYDEAYQIVMEAAAEMRENKPTPDGAPAPVIKKWLETCNLEDAAIIAIDSLGAAVDTTSVSLANFLRNMAANPRAQKKCQEEVDRVLAPGEVITAEKVEQLPYLRACLKESMRLTPTSGGTFRTLEKDLILSGYRVPANTFATVNFHITCTLEENFPDAKMFIPERWLKDTTSPYTAKESFAYQPFSFGPRMCPGKRLSEMELITMTTKVMQNFWLENKHPEVETAYRLVIMITSPLQIEFYDRR